MFIPAHFRFFLSVFLLFLLSCRSSGNHHRTFLYQSNTLTADAAAGCYCCLSYHHASPCKYISARQLTLAYHYCHCCCYPTNVHKFVCKCLRATVASLCLRVHRISHRNHGIWLGFQNPPKRTYSEIVRGKKTMITAISSKPSLDGYMCHESCSVKSRRKQTQLFCKYWL